MRRRASKIACALAALALTGAAAPVAAQTERPSTGAPVTPTIYIMEQLQTGPLAADVLQKMGPLHSLEQVEDLLKESHTAFAWRHAEISTDAIPPALARQIAALPPHEVFLAPQGQGWLIGVVVGKRP